MEHENKNEYTPRQGDFIHENEEDKMDAAACPECGKRLKFEFVRDYDRGNHWDATCCGRTYRAYEGWQIATEIAADAPAKAHNDGQLWYARCPACGAREEDGKIGHIDRIIENPPAGEGHVETHVYECDVCHAGFTISAGPDFVLSAAQANSGPKRRGQLL